MKKNFCFFLLRNIQVRNDDVMLSIPPSLSFFVLPCLSSSPHFLFQTTPHLKSSRCTDSPTPYSLQDTLVDLGGRGDHSPQKFHKMQ